MDTIIIDGLAFTLPMFIMAIGGIFSEKSGITNLALEGLQGFGAFCGALIAVLITRSSGSHGSIPFYASFLAAVLGGMLYAMVHVILCIRFRANQVISGVVINILAMALTAFLTKRINEFAFNARSDKFVLETSVRFTVPGLSEIPVLGAVFTRVYPFEVLIILVAAVTWYVMYRTTYGLHLRACGDNPHAADAAGINVDRVRTIAVVLSGGLSAIGGMSYAYSISACFSPDIYLGYGYLAIAALIFGNWSIMPTLGACLLFGFARSAGSAIIQRLGMPSTFNDLVRILPYVLTLVLLIFFSKDNKSPRALGEIYDKGKR
ncbi:MAG TPA: ABC transporter permease [Lachnospiraceae bacterium]|nr:ABC transporter permease [Lachnospiraceae bacterium]